MTSVCVEGRREEPDRRHISPVLAPVAAKKDVVSATSSIVS